MVKLKSNNAPHTRVFLVLIALLIGAVCLYSGFSHAQTAKVMRETEAVSEETAGSRHLPPTTAEAVESATLAPELTSKAATSITQALSSSSAATTKKATSSKTTSSTSKASSSSSEPSESVATTSREGLTDKIGSIVSRLGGADGRLNPFASTAASTTASTTAKKAELDFSRTAFLGNSRVLSIENYGFSKNVYGKVSLNVNTVFTEKCEGGSVPVIDELRGKDFDNVMIMFGDNECGWGSMDAFVKQYKKVIAGVRERVPGVKIYLISILPISYATSQKNEYGYNQGKINECNELIKKIAKDEGITYLDASSSIMNDKGYLPDEASTDGCHLGKEYTKRWLTYVAKYI